MQCCNQINCKTMCISFATNYICIPTFNQFTLYNLTDWGYIRNLYHTHFTPLWWIKTSPPQASPINSLWIVLCRCLISSSQTAWENSEAAVTQLLRLCSLRNSVGNEDGDVTVETRGVPVPSCATHTEWQTFQDFHSIITWGLVVNMMMLC